jgi:hypothetical protein
MTLFRRVLSSAALIVAAAGFASANSITDNCGGTNGGTFATTELVQASVTCNQAGFYGIQASWLNSITITLGGEIQGTIDLQNNAVNPQSTNATTISAFFLDAALQGFSFTTGNPLFSSSFSTGIQTLDPGGVFDSPALDSCASNQGTVLCNASSEVSQTITSGFAPYSGNGTFAVSFDTQSGISLVGGGGNIGSTQATMAEGAVAITFDYTVPGTTPEPASLVLMGGALIGLGLLGKKRYSKH